MLTSQRTWLHIGILHQVLKRKTDGAHMQAGYQRSSKRQGYYLIKSHGRQWYIHHENKPTALTLFRSYFDVLHVTPWKMVTLCSAFTYLIFLGTSSFSLHSWTTLGEHDAISYAFKGEGVWSVVQDTGRNFPFMKVSLSPLSQFLDRHRERGNSCLIEHEKLKKELQKDSSVLLMYFHILHLIS